MCNKVNTDHISLSKFFISDSLTNLLCTHLYPVKLFCSLIFKASFSECLGRQEIVLLKEGLGL